jgi:PadR family transcriptional regulator, regulatory protein AphA
LRVETPERGPSKKVYSITDQGRARLRTELLQPPELPQVRNPFLASIAFMDALRVDGTLSDGEVAEQFQAYSDLLETEIVTWKERARRMIADETSATQNSKAKVVLQAMHRRWIDYYEREKRWIDQLADQLAESTQEERDDH